MKKYILLSIVCIIALTSFGQQKKDSLFFYYNNEYLIEKEHAPGLLYPKDFQSDEGSLFFKKKGIYYKYNPTEILCLEEFLHSLKIKKNKFDKLTTYLGQFKLFLIKEEKGKTRYIEVSPGTEIN